MRPEGEEHVADGIIIRKQQEPGSLGFAGLPTIILAAVERASLRFIEFFTANIRNLEHARFVRPRCWRVLPVGRRSWLPTRNDQFGALRWIH